MAWDNFAWPFQGMCSLLGLLLALEAANPPTYAESPTAAAPSCGSWAGFYGKALSSKEKPFYGCYEE